jgi:hypothetical protein
MKSTILWALGALNVLLVVALINKYVPEQKATAQAARPSDYLMVPGELTGIPNGVIFIIDTNNGQLSAMSYDDNTNNLNPMPRIDLGQVFKAGAGIGNGGKPPKAR